MASIDEEILMDDEENRREIAFIREQLPSELKEKYSDDDLLYMLDAISEYFYSSGILESNEDEVEIDMEVISDHVCKQAKADGVGPYDAQEVFFVVEADLDFQEQE